MPISLPRATSVLLAAGCALAAALAGCTPPQELRLTLAAVAPDPLAGAAALQLSFDDGSGARRTVELAVREGVIEGDAGLRGTALCDLELVALDDAGVAIARGRRDGELTPADDAGRDETVVLLRVGVFSRVEGLALDTPRGAGGVGVAVDGGAALVAGGGGDAVERLDLQRGVGTVGGALDAGDDGTVEAVALEDGRVVFGRERRTALTLVDGASGVALATADDASAQAGALVALRGGAAAWWCGLDGDDAPASRVIASGAAAPSDAPTPDDGPSQPRRVACAGDGERCAMVPHDGDGGWLRFDAGDVLDHGPAIGFSPAPHTGSLASGQVRGAVPAGDDTIAVLVEHDGDTTVHVLDLSGDGQLAATLPLPSGLVGVGIARRASGGAWLVGGTDGDGASDALWALEQRGDSWVLELHDARMARGRGDGIVVGLGDGRVMVAGGEDGEAVDLVEVFEP